MLDGVTLDQIRTFIAAADEGSFSAAGRRLRRAQSVVSQTLANLETQLGLVLFDRSGRYPRLTDDGRALLEEARLVAAGIDTLKARARSLAEGLEPELAVSVDVMFPVAALTRAVGGFREAFPSTSVRLHVEALGAVVQPVITGQCRFAVIGTLPTVPKGFASVPLPPVAMATVVAAAHPFAARRDRIPATDLARHPQLVLTDRSSLTEGRTFAVSGTHVWRLADLGAKHAFLKAGFGWGHMPVPMVAADLASGALVAIRVEGTDDGAMSMPMRAAWRRDAPPGPAGRWFIERLTAG